MLTVIISYQRNKPALAQLLVSLQPQLHPDDDIYVLDESSDRSAVELVKRYGSTRCYIFVEPTKKRGSEAIMFGLQSMKENKQEGALILNPNVIIPNTFIANLKKIVNRGYDFVTFDEHYVQEMDPNFKWFTPAPQVKESEGADKDNFIDNAFINISNMYVSHRKALDTEVDVMNNAKIACIESEYIVILD